MLQDNAVVNCKRCINQIMKYTMVTKPDESNHYTMHMCMTLA